MNTYTIKYLKSDYDPIDKKYNYMNVLAKDKKQAQKTFNTIARYIEKSEKINIIYRQVFAIN